MIGTVPGAGTTLNIFDIFDVGAGTDTLNLITSAATAMSAGNVPTLNGVEIINLNSLSGASSLVSTVAPQLTTLNLNSYAAASAMTVTVASAAMRTFGITNSVFDVNDLTVTYATGASSSATDTVTLNLNVVNGPTAGAANDALITFAGAAAGVNSGIETFVVNATGTNALESLISLEVAAGATALSALTVNGTGSLTVDTALVFDSTNIGTINASGNSGGTNLGVGTINLTYTGGSGNDVLRFTTAGDLDSNDTINMGTGTDTIVLADTAVNSTTTALNAAITATGAEIIGFSAAATTVDMSAVAATQVASYQTADGNLTFQKLLSTDTVIITQGVSADADVIVSGQLGFTTANVTLQGSATAGVSMDDLTAQNLATVNINSAGGSAAVNTLNNLVLSANSVVTVTGTQGLTITNALENTAVVINGSAMTGVLTVIAGTTASSLVGGSAIDVITGGTGADTIVGGAGNDTLRTGNDIAANGTVIGGLGADAIAIQNTTTAALAMGISATAAESYATTGQFDTVTSVAIDNTDATAITVTTGVLSSTMTAATSVNLGVTTVTAGAFLVVAATAALTATNQNISLYQDSNSNGIIESTDLRIDFTRTGNDTITAAVVGNKAVITFTGVTD